MNEVIDESDTEGKQYRVTSSELKSFVERFETLDLQKKDLLD